MNQLAHFSLAGLLPLPIESFHKKMFVSENRSVWMKSTTLIIFLGNSTS
jgi:hypothetical protein